MLKKISVALLALVSITAIGAYAIFYSPNPAKMVGQSTASASPEMDEAAWEASFDWPTAERARLAHTIVLVRFEKSWFGYHKAVVVDVLKRKRSSLSLPLAGQEFGQGSFQKLDSHDYGDGAVYFFYGAEQPLEEEHVFYEDGLLRDDAGTSVAALRGFAGSEAADP